MQANLRLLEARLSAEYFEVMTVASGAEALEACEQGNCDIVLLDVMMPEMDGFEVARRLKSNPSTHHIPIIMLTALDQPSDRVRGLDAGADEFLTKPVNDIALVARVRSLVRLKMVTDELRMRAVTSSEIGVADHAFEAANDAGLNARVLVVDDRKASAVRIDAAVGKQQTIEFEEDPQDALFRIADGNYDLVLISLDLAHYDALRLVGQVRSLERTRHLPILLVTDPGHDARVLRGLDLGANDYVLRSADRE